MLILKNALLILKFPRPICKNKLQKVSFFTQRNSLPQRTLVYDSDAIEPDRFVEVAEFTRSLRERAEWDGSLTSAR
jgi:hypothetical protein